MYTLKFAAAVLGEPRAQACREALRSETDRSMSAGTMAEALIVATHRGFADALLSLVEGFAIEIIPVTEASARRVAAAHERWDCGARTAGLDVGDGFAYEVALANDCPQLHVTGLAAHRNRPYRGFRYVGPSGT